VVRAFLVPLWRLQPPRVNVPHGLNLEVVAHHSYALRRDPGHHTEPVVVDAEDGGLLRIHDGRHRWIGYISAGRNEILVRLR